jgi:acetone carboxylase alpha subunit
MGGYPAATRYRYTLTNTNFKEAVEQQLPLPHEEGDPANPDFARLLKGTLNRTPGQSASVQFQRYDIIHQTTGGGGGWGDPLERDPEVVVQELNEGLTLERTLKNVYGVVAEKVSDDEWVLDVDATNRLRRDIRSQRLARAVPTKDFLARERESVLAGGFAPIVKEMFNDCFNNSERFFKEYKEFWNLPESWAGF